MDSSTWVERPPALEEIVTALQPKEKVKADPYGFKTTQYVLDIKIVITKFYHFDVDRGIVN